ncbi:mucin-5AC-like [Vigna unguiculata]|uniref:mucin-5AC-like n=1 Tax=Vigna unguiculata TaxID=3917 RepID=UPI00101659CF|nr:mucin-5AC-like [Vigna unguiculata]
MNRSFIAPESKMQDAFKLRQQQLGALRSSVRAKERDEELALFLEMRSREKAERGDLMLRAAEDFDGAAALGSNPDNSPLFHVPSSMAALVRKTGADDFLNSDNDKNDYDWLLTPPGTPLFPSLEMESTKTVMSQLGAPTLRPTSLKTRLSNPPSEHTGRSNFVSKQPASSPGLTSSGGGLRRPSSSGSLSELAGRSNLVSKQPASSPGLSSSVGGTRRSSSSGNLGARSVTPTGRPTLTTVSKSSRPSTPTSRTTMPSTRAMVATTKTSVSSAKPMVSAAKAAVSVAKTSTVPAAKTTIPSRSSTPLSRSTTRSSTPTTRTTLPASRPTSRASTPTRRPTTPSNVPTVSSPSVKTSSISKSAPVRQPITSPGTSPTVKSSPRPWKPSDMPGFSLDAPPNLRTTLPERALSTTRGRPGAPSSRSASVEPPSIGRPRRQSCSPSRGRSSNGISHPTGSSMPAVNRGYSRANDNVSPVVMGTKMVERVVNMRKLAPPRLDDRNSSHNLSGKSSSSPDTSGFGRSLSKKSLDMAIRHMDIRRRVPGNLRSSLMTNIPASSMYSVRSGPQRSRTVSISGSPHATSSNASSEVSVNPNGLCLDISEIDDDIGSERSGQSPASVRGR